MVGFAVGMFTPDGVVLSGGRVAVEGERRRGSLKGLRFVAFGSGSSGLRIIVWIGVRSVGRIDCSQGIVHNLFGGLIVDKSIGRCCRSLLSHLRLLCSWMLKMSGVDASI